MSDDEDQPVCDCCGYETKTKEYGDDNPALRRIKQDLCLLCANSFVATENEYGDASNEGKAILYVGNAILDAIKNLPVPIKGVVDRNDCDGAHAVLDQDNNTVRIECAECQSTIVVFELVAPR